MIAGLFVLLSMGLAVGVSVAVSGVQKRLVPTRAYGVEFTLADGAAGLKEGSPVMLGGQEVGRVSGIEFVEQDGRAAAIRVRILVHSNIRLHTDAWAFLERPLLGSMSAINISRVGGEKDPANPGAAPAPVLAEGQVLKGIIAPPAFLAQAGFGPDQAKQVQKIFNDVEEAVDRLNVMTQRLDSQIEPSLADVRRSLEDINAVTADARAKWTQAWSGQVDSVLASADKAGETLNRTLDGGEQLVASIRKTVEDNTPTLEHALKTIDEAMTKLNDEAVGKLSAALDEGKAGAEAFRQLSEDVARVVQTETPGLRKTLGNLRLAADQVKLLGVEVRRNPWRLLYTPKTKELESELLYDAARTYAEAVSDLRSASESLEALQNGGGEAAPDRETAEHIRQRLAEAFERYKTAEKALLEKMSAGN